MALSQEGMLDFQYALSLPPTIVEAFIRVVNKRSEEQQEEMDKNRDNEKSKGQHKSSPEEFQSTPPPKLGEKEKVKLGEKLADFSNWMEDEDFKERYNQAKAQTYSKENW